jgi:hypothetical protein
MTSDDLTKDQAEKLLVTVRPMLNFLHRLVHRLDTIGFPSDDRIYRAVCKAYDGVHELHVVATRNGEWRRETIKEGPSRTMLGRKQAGGGNCQPNLLIGFLARFW